MVRVAYLIDLLYYCIWITKGDIYRMNVTEEQKCRMAKNLRKSFELLNTIMKLRLAYLKKMNPGKTETELIHRIHLEAIESKEKQWNSEKI